jgi:hypothetical protein
MATWIGLGDNTELFWAVMSHSSTSYVTPSLGRYFDFLCRVTIGVMVSFTLLGFTSRI